mmetsp:Transcript_33877/g.24932  ORF Transcript_33877/g.24932 Transcript_33877/m.24932 type:complete len:322 (-) Transcript_33877:362-1327(-)
MYESWPEVGTPANIQSVYSPELFTFSSLEQVGLGEVSSDSVAQIVDSLQGLMNQYQATLFVVNVSSGAQEWVDAYESKFLVDDAELLLLALRYMVQDFLMGGAVVTAPIEQWITGMDFDFVDIIKDGEFLEGTDKDLLNTVYPVFNTPMNALIYDTKIRMDAGFTYKDKIAHTRLINMLPTINKNQYIYNGTDPSLLQLNPWATKVELNKATNGMQFPPDTEDGTGVSFYDNRILRRVDMEQVGEQASNVDDKYQYRVYGLAQSSSEEYGEAAQGTWDISPGFDIPVAQAVKGGIQLDPAMTGKLLVDGEEFPSGTDAGTY